MTFPRAGYTPCGKNLFRNAAFLIFHQRVEFYLGEVKNSKVVKKSVFGHANSSKYHDFLLFVPWVIRLEVAC